MVLQKSEHGPCGSSYSETPFWLIFLVFWKYLELLKILYCNHHIQSSLFRYPKHSHVIEIWENLKQCSKIGNLDEVSPLSIFDLIEKFFCSFCLRGWAFSFIFSNAWLLNFSKEQMKRFSMLLATSRSTFEFFFFLKWVTLPLAKFKSETVGKDLVTWEKQNLTCKKRKRGTLCYKKGELASSLWTEVPLEGKNFN